MLTEHGFDLGVASRLFPGWVLERRNTRLYRETRFRAIGEMPCIVRFAVYPRSGSIGRSITPRSLIPMTEDRAATDCDDGLVEADLNDPLRGRIDPARIGNTNLVRSEPCPIVTPEDRAKTLSLVALERQRMARKAI